VRSRRRSLGIRLSCLILLLLVPGGFAAAQASKEIDARKMLACAAKSNSLERLACFDDLAKTLGPIQEQQSNTVGRWTIETNVSRFDDTMSVHLSLTANEKINGWLGKSHVPVMNIRCRERKTEAYIDFGMSPAAEPELYDGATLQFRIDKQPLFKAVATKSPDGTTLFLKDPTPFIKRMFKAEHLLVRFIPFTSSAQETTFSIAGLEKAILPLTEACKWPK
jgi:type VI secretion system protein VasI